MASGRPKMSLFCLLQLIPDVSTNYGFSQNEL